MNRTFIILLLSFLFYSCESDLITVLDEYNPPYEIVAIPRNGGITVNFISGILASDFAGFNIYVDNFTQPTGALLGTTGALPTVIDENHVREPFYLPVPGTYANGTQYTIALTAYGTNDLADNGYIETKINATYTVVPRPEGSVTSTSTVAIPVAGVIANITGSLIQVTGTYKIQYFGTQSSFTNITIITNNNYTTDFNAHAIPAIANGVYVLKDSGNNFVKIWIKSISGGNITFDWAHRSDTHPSNSI